MRAMSDLDVGARAIELGEMADDQSVGGIPRRAFVDLLRGNRVAVCERLP
jgi:hypothetical protein